MQKYVIALYIRLSIEDYKYDSLSIENQSLVLHEYAASMPEALNAEVMEFIDNGYSGTNFERPQVQKLIELVRANQIDCIIVKDFSRFGRNSIETGYFIERVFPLFHTRFISISDDFDSSKFKGDTGGMDVAFKYLISEYCGAKNTFPNLFTYASASSSPFCGVECTALIRQQLHAGTGGDVAGAMRELCRVLPALEVGGDQYDPGHVSSGSMRRWLRTALSKLT